jgi:hypothetical protein
MSTFRIPFLPKTSDNLNRLAKMSEVHGLHVTSGPDGTVVGRGRRKCQLRPFPWSDKLTFGLVRTAGNKIKVVNCKARRYNDYQGTTIWYKCADKEYDFTTYDNTNGVHIVWRWTKLTGDRKSVV